MRTRARAGVLAVPCLLALVVSIPLRLDAAPQEPAGPPPVSLERIKKGLESKPGPGLKLDKQLPPPTFKVKIEQRQFMLPFIEQLRKEFALNDLQRQSADWASKCCGLDFGQLTTALKKARQRQQERKIREQIARELAFLEAAARIK